MNAAASLKEKVASARAQGWNVAVVSGPVDLVLSGLPGFDWRTVAEE
jgi:hypothetical protein